MADIITIEQMFGALVRQETLEDAAQEMAALATSYPEMVGEVRVALTKAIVASDGQSVIDAVNLSGYRVTEVAEAKKYCKELLDLFMARLADGA